MSDQHSAFAPTALTLSVRDVIPIVVDYLAAMFPERGYRAGDSLEELAFAAGQHSVVEHLKALLNDEDDNVH